MAKVALLSLSLAGLLAACAHVQQPEQDPEALRRRIRELTEELGAARAESFALRLRLARAEKQADEESRLLREDGLKSPHDAVRLVAIREIGAMPADRQKSFTDALTACARSGSPAVRGEAVIALGRIPSAEPAVLEAAADPSAELRRAAAVALRSASPAAIDALTKLAADPVREVRIAALESAAAARHERTFAAIVKAATEDTDAAVVEKAIDILGVLANPAAAPAILDVLSRAPTDPIRWSSINALGKIGVAAAAAAPAIRPYLERRNTVSLRDIAAQALGKLRDTESVPALVAALKEDPEPRVRQAAARALGNIGGSALLRDTLLPAALGKDDPDLARAAWEGSLAAAGERFPDLLFIAETMLENGRRADADAVATRIQALTLEREERAQAVRILERIADAAIEARDWRGALARLRALRTLDSTRADFARRIARCHRELGEHEAAHKALIEAMALTEAQGPLWWDLKAEQIACLEDARMPARVVEEAAAAVNGKAAPESAAAAIDASRRRATQALMADLGSADAAIRQRTAELVRPLGKRIILALADAVLDTSLASRTGVLDVGNAIAGTQHTDLAKAPEIAESWRAWAKK